MAKIKNYPNFQVKEIYDDGELQKVEIYNIKTNQSLKISAEKVKELADLLIDIIK